MWMSEGRNILGRLKNEYKGLEGKGFLVYIGNTEKPVRLERSEQIRKQ